MAEFTKGKLSIKDTNEHGDYYIGNKDSYSYIAIVVAEILSPENVAEANAKELVRRWNSYDDLLAACEIVLRSKDLVLPKGLVRAEHRDEVAALQKMYTKLEAAIAQAKKS